MSFEHNYIAVITLACLLLSSKVKAKLPRVCERVYVHARVCVFVCCA